VGDAIGCRAVASRMAGGPCVFSPRSRIWRSGRSQRGLVDPTAIRPGRAASTDGGSGARCGFPQCRCESTRAGAGSGRLDVPRACRRPLAGDDLLVSLHRRQRRRQPRRAYHNRPACQRPAPRPLRLRIMQQRQRRRAERVSPHDLGGRACAGRSQARLRAPPRRLHLRSRRIPRRSAAPLFTHRLRPWPHSRRPEGEQFPRADQPRRLSSCLSRTYQRSRHPGRPRVFSLHLHRRQSRILVARLAELHRIRRQGRARATPARRRQSGMVGIYPVARSQGLGPQARPVRPARGNDRADRQIRRSWIRQRGQQPHRRRQHDRLSHRALRQACRPDPHRLPQLRHAQSRGAARNRRVRL